MSPHRLISAWPRLASAATVCVAALAPGGAQAGLVTLASFDFNQPVCDTNTVGGGWVEDEDKKKPASIRLSDVGAGNCAVLLDDKKATFSHDWTLADIADSTRLTLNFDTKGAGGSANANAASKDYLSMWWGVLPDWQTSVIVDQLGYTDFTRVTTTGRVSEFTVKAGQTVRLMFQAAAVAAYIDNIAITYEVADPVQPVEPLPDPSANGVPAGSPPPPTVPQAPVPAPTAVPEPASLALVVLGLGLAAGTGQRRRLGPMPA